MNGEARNSSSAAISPNFSFLAEYDELLCRSAVQAERYLFDDPNISLYKLRQFGELLAREVAARTGVDVYPEDTAVMVLRKIEDRGALPSKAAQLFHSIRRTGNRAVHEMTGDRGGALYHLRMARELAVWFHKTFGKKPALAAGPFIPPPDPQEAETDLTGELERLRKLLEEAQKVGETEAERRREAEAGAKAMYDELAAAMSLAEETEDQLIAEKKRFDAHIASLQAETNAKSSEAMRLLLASAQKADDAIDLNEADTRRLIDEQLRDAGWTADTRNFTYKKGIRPQKGKNIAIAEWPVATSLADTEKGPKGNDWADYVLFEGLTAVAKGDAMDVYRQKTHTVDTVFAPDDITIEVDKFNTAVLTDPFNETVCAELARHIDPTLPGKTLIFCATDNHADTVVDLLKKAFEVHYGQVDDDAVVKITAASDKPLNKIRHYKYEKLPSVVITVDLLTTAIDVPEIVNIVFIRRVKSRILYEQMLGRATRRCDEIGKELFRIFDAVDLYAALEPHSSMKPVVPDPKITFAQLVTELITVGDEDHCREIREQIVAKLQRKRRLIEGEEEDRFRMIAGTGRAEALKSLRKMTGTEAKDWFCDRPDLAKYLDELKGEGDFKILVSNHEDELKEVIHGFGDHQKPQDYLESFGTYIRENLNRIPALIVVTTRPRDLTRDQLRELKLLLDTEGYREPSLRAAWKDTTNEDIAASIIGFIHQMVLGSPLSCWAETPIVRDKITPLQLESSFEPGSVKLQSQIAQANKRKVLLSIKPEYAAKIMSGEKRYEFRRRIFQRKGITTVVIYVTSPMKKVIGEFVVGEIIEREVKALWEETRQFGGIEKDAFDNYFIGKNIGFAIEVGQVIKYKRPRDLCEIRPGLDPPQSFAYI